MSDSGSCVAPARKSRLSPADAPVTTAPLALEPEDVPGCSAAGRPATTPAIRRRTTRGRTSGSETWNTRGSTRSSSTRRERARVQKGRPEAARAPGGGRPRAGRRSRASVCVCVCVWADVESRSLAVRCNTRVDLERRNVRRGLAPAAFARSSRGPRASSASSPRARGRARVHIKVAKVGWRPAQVTWADVDGDGVARKVTVLWDARPTGSAARDFALENQRGGPARAEASAGAAAAPAAAATRSRRRGSTGLTQFAPSPRARSRWPRSAARSSRRARRAMEAIGALAPAYFDEAVKKEVSVGDEPTCATSRSRRGAAAAALAGLAGVDARERSAAAAAGLAARARAALAARARRALADRGTPTRPTAGPRSSSSAAARPCAVGALRLRPARAARPGRVVVGRRRRPRVPEPPPAAPRRASVAAHRGRAVAARRRLSR